MSDIKRIATGPRMSQAVIAGGIVWLAGQVGEPGASVADQTRVVLEQVGPDDEVVRVTLSMHQLTELRLALNLPEGNYRIDRD